MEDSVDSILEGARPPEPEDDGFTDRVMNALRATELFDVSRKQDGKRRLFRRLIRNRRRTRE